MQFILLFLISIIKSTQSSNQIYEYQSEEQFFEDIEHFNQIGVFFYEDEIMEQIHFIDEIQNILTKPNLTRFAKFNLRNCDLIRKRFFIPSDDPSFFLFEKNRNYQYESLMNYEADKQLFKQFILSHVEKKIQLIQQNWELTKFLEKPSNTKLIAVYDPSMQEELQVLQDMHENMIFSQFTSVDIGHITDKSIFLEGKEGIPYPSLIIYRATEDEFSFMDQDFQNQTIIEEFFVKKALDKITILSEETVQLVFAGPYNSSVFLILDSQNTTLRKKNIKAINQFEIISEYNDKQEPKQFINVLHDVSHYQNNFLGQKFMSQLDLPAFVIVHQEEDEEVSKIKGYPEIIIKKYVFDKEIKQNKMRHNNMRGFQQAFLNKSLDEWIFTEPIEEHFNVIFQAHEWQKKNIRRKEQFTYRKLIGENFEQKIYNKTQKQNALIFFCATRTFCQEQFTIFEKTIDIYETHLRNTSINTELEFFYLDLDKNEVRYPEVQEYPAIYLVLDSDKNQTIRFPTPIIHQNEVLEWAFDFLIKHQMKKEAKDLNIKDKEFAKLMEEMLLIQRQVKDGKSEEYIQELYDQKIEAEKEQKKRETLEAMESLRKNYEENYINDYKDGNTKNLEYPDMNKKAPSIPPEALEKLKQIRVQEIQREVIRLREEKQRQQNENNLDKVEL